MSFLTLSVICSISPLSAVNLSKMLQKNKLEKLLKIPKESISQENEKEIYEILDYFDRKHSLKDTKLTKEDTDPISLMKALGYDYRAYGFEENSFTGYNFGGSSKIYDVNDYDYFIPRMANKYNYKDFSIDFSTNNLIVISEKNFVKNIKIEDIAIYLIKNYSSGAEIVNGQTINNLEYKVSLPEINKELIFIINDLNCSYEENRGEVKDVYFEGVCFIKNIKTN